MCLDPSRLPRSGCLTSLKYKVSTLGRHGRWLEIFVSPCVDTAPGLAGVEPWVVRILDNFVFARPALKRNQVDAQEPAKLRRGDYDFVSRRSAFQGRISHPGRDGRQHRGGPAWVAR